MKRLCMAIVLFALEIGGCFWNTYTVEQDVNRMVATLQTGAVADAYRQWKQSDPKFGALMMHVDLENVERLFIRLQYAEVTSVDYAMDFAELVGQLQQLPELSRPTLKNIF